MPRYEYRCETNGRVVEVSHPMSLRLSTWGEVCELSGQETGCTPADAPVEKVISLSYVAGSQRGGGGSMGGGCGAGCGCHPR